MKNLLITTALLSFLLTSCLAPDQEPYDYKCERPADIPDVFDWDCRLQGFYNEGQVKVIMDKEGKPFGLAIIYDKEDEMPKIPVNGEWE